MSANMTSTSSSAKGRSSRSPLLDYSRRTQAEAMESRIATRIEDLLDGELGSDHREKASLDEIALQVWCEYMRLAS